MQELLVFVFNYFYTGYFGYIVAYVLNHASIQCVSTFFDITTLLCEANTIWFQISCDNISWIFVSALHIMKLLTSKILVFHIFSGYEYFKAVSKSFLLSPNGNFPIAVPFHLYFYKLCNCNNL